MSVRIGTKRRRSFGANFVSDSPHRDDGDVAEEETSNETEGLKLLNSMLNDKTENCEFALDAIEKKKPSIFDKKSPCPTENENREWVRCNSCDKWRALPASVDVSKLPEIWFCSLNEDPLRNSCEDSEEDYEQVDSNLKSFFKLWVKKLKNADRAESRLISSIGTRGVNKKKRTEVDWIKCSNPTCGKWRSVLRSIETTSMMQRLNGTRWGKSKSADMQWFCSMNTWDESQASCGAAQEPLYNCEWNMKK